MQSMHVLVTWWCLKEGRRMYQSMSVGQISAFSLTIILIESYKCARMTQSDSFVIFFIKRSYDHKIPREKTQKWEGT